MTPEVRDADQVLYICYNKCVDTGMPEGVGFDHTTNRKEAPTMDANKIRDEVHAEILAELAQTAPGGARTQSAAGSECVSLDELEGLLSIRPTLERFACVVAEHVAEGATLTLPRIVAFLATLNETELWALTKRDDVEQVVSVALAHLPIGQRAVVVRGLHAVADSILDLAVDVIGLADS